MKYMIEIYLTVLFVVAMVGVGFQTNYAYENQVVAVAPVAMYTLSANQQ